MIRGDTKLRIFGLLLLLTLVRGQPIVRRPTIFEQMLASIRNIESLIRDSSIAMSAILAEKKLVAAEKWSNPYVLLDLERIESSPSSRNRGFTRRSNGLQEPSINTGGYLADYTELNDYGDLMNSEERKLFEPMPQFVTLRQRRPVQVERSQMSAEDDSSNVNMNVNTNVNENGNPIDRALKPKFNKHGFP